jgi:hypothetical protein
VTQDANFSVTVTALDANNNVATGYVGRVTFDSSDPNATTPDDYTFVAADRGVHTFTFALDSLGTYTVSATDTNTSSITGSASVLDHT